MDDFLDAVINILPDGAKDIDRDLLTLAFLTKSSKSLLSEEDLRTILEKYGITSYQSLEFLGDGVLEITLKHMIYQALSPEGPGAMSRVISVLRSNNFLSCLANRHNLCISGIRGSPAKLCADVFEALLGAIFLHLVDQGLDAYRIIYQWLAEFWELPKYIGLFLARQNDVCFKESRITPPDVNLYQVKVPLTLLPEKSTDILSQAQNLDVEDLSLLIEQLQEEYLERTIYQNPEQTLTTMFQQLGLRQPRYILNQPTGIVVPCPLELCPGGGFLGLSENRDITAARQEASRQAITSLRDMGLVDF